MWIFGAFARLVEFALQDERNVILVSFGNPLPSQTLPLSAGVSLCLQLYFDLMTEAAWMLSLASGFHGHLPVTIPGICERGTGCTY